MSLRTLFALFTLTTLSTLATACDDTGEECAYGPTELRDVPLTAVAGEPIEAFIMFPPEGVGSFNFLSAEEAPETLALTLSDEGVTIRGTIAEAGSYTFWVGVEEEKGEVCAAWGGYEVTLTVE